VSGNSTTGEYVRRHNPFISFNDIRTNPQRCGHLVNSDQLAADIAANQLPRFSFYVPNLNNDGHDTSPEYAANWLNGFLEPKLADPNFINGTLVVVTFDEDDGTSSNLVYTVLLGSMVHANSTDSSSYTHYSLLRTIEDDFGVGSLNRKDATAVHFAACNFSTGCNP
jgi:phospholipase C